MSSTSIDICLCCDQHVVDGLICVIASASRHLRRGVTLNVHVIDLGLGEKLRRKVKEIVKNRLPNTTLEIIELAQERVDAFPRALRHRTNTPYAKLLLHELLPSLDRVIYLDCDILIKDDLTKLYRIEIGENVIAAVQDVTILNLGGKMENIGDKYPGMDLSAIYFNSGVFIANLKYWRSTGVESLFYQTADVLQPQFPDQSVLNVVFSKQCYCLDTPWNKQVFLSRKFNLFSDRKVAILHFTRDVKPWDIQEVGARGMVAEWYAELKKIGWQPVAVPHVKVNASRMRDSIKWVTSLILRNIKGSKP